MSLRERLEGAGLIEPRVAEEQMPVADWQPAKWVHHFMALARVWASRSKDPSTQVGCVARNDDRLQLGSGYNGLPRGVQDLPERMERPQKYLWTAHAEENLVAQAARQVLLGSTVSVTHMCCARCARSLINAGVKRVEFDGAGTTSMPAEEFEVARIMFEEAGVELVMLP